ncbi:hypothetical protein Ancab_017306 [Ancistrocladus abbreviatus]
MATFSGLMLKFSVLASHGGPMMPIPFQKHKEAKTSDFLAVKLGLDWIPGAKYRCLRQKWLPPHCASPTGRSYQDLKFEYEYQEDSFLVNSFKEAIGALKTLFSFLAEQPSQLKYIEWPSFQSTLRTATLTLVLVALLIVALSSIDSALSFLLAFFLRRRP